MKDFLGLKDDSIRAEFTEVILVREVVKIPIRDREALESRANKAGITKTDVMRIGLEYAMQLDDETLRAKNLNLTRGKKKRKV